MFPLLATPLSLMALVCPLIRRQLRLAKMPLRHQVRLVLGLKAFRTRLTPPQSGLVMLRRRGVLQMLEPMLQRRVQLQVMQQVLLLMSLALAATQCRQLRVITVGEKRLPKQRIRLRQRRAQQSGLHSGIGQFPLTGIFLA